MAENERTLNGITFSTAEEYLQAKKELEGIRYVKENNDMNNEQTVLALYNKFVQKNVFRTQIGYDFMKGLQEQLMRSANIDKSQIAKLPIRDFGEEDREKAQDKKNVTENKSVAKVPAKTQTNASRADVTSTKKNTARTEQKKPMIYLEAERAAKKNPELEQIKSKYKWSIFLNILLIAVIIAMAYITLNGNRVNILNYETKLQDKYASWEQDLLEKEEELNKLRNELNSMLPD